MNCSTPLQASVLLLPMLFTALLASCAVPALALSKLREHSSTQFKRNPSLQECLFPSSETYTSGFTTAAGIQVTGVKTVPLSDSTLGVYKVASGYTHDLVQQGGKAAWQAVYNQGSYNPASGGTKGGFSFYVNGTQEFSSALASGVYGVMFGYSVMFQQDFQWNLGGKLPGACKFIIVSENISSNQHSSDGGKGSLAQECSGGRQDGRDDCFDLRLMWRYEKI